LFRVAKQKAIASIHRAYNSNRLRKSQYRSLCIVRVNARVRITGCNYSSFLHSLQRQKCYINLKILAQLAVYDPAAFYTLRSLFIYIMAISICKKTTLPFTPQYTIHYKNVTLLRRYIGTQGQILPRSSTSLSAKENRHISKAIRRARRIGLLPYVLPIPLHTK
jgi:ribosomal protein L20/ribosomal protein S18